MKKLFIFVALSLFAITAFAGVVNLLSGAKTTGAGTGVNLNGAAANRWAQASLIGASAVSATVEIDGSNDNSNWVPIATLVLAASPAASATAATNTVQSAEYMRGNIIAISGVGESVNLSTAQ